MAVRQYIGARYVTKIYENSLDPSSAEWESGVNYEPLTMVTFNNGSYLSKKEVPGSVGDPAINPTYWVQTGFYNGQIAQLQNDVSSLQGDVSTLQDDVLALGANRRYVVICDSYGGNLNGDGRTFYEEAFHQLGITDYFAYWRGSAGFCQSGTLNFLAVLQDNESAITDKDTITDVIVLGGANDQLNPTDTLAGIQAFAAYVKANYPVAKITIGHFSADMHTVIDKFEASVEEYMKASIYGVAYVENSEYIMRMLDGFNSDIVHPNATGLDRLTKYFAQYLVDGHINVKESSTATSSVSTENTSLSVTAGSKLYQVQHNGNVSLLSADQMYMAEINVTTPISLNAGYTGISKFVYLTKGAFYPYKANSISIPVKIFNGSGEAYDALLIPGAPAAVDKVSCYAYVFSQAAATLSGSYYIAFGVGSYTF